MAPIRMSTTPAVLSGRLMVSLLFGCVSMAGFAQAATGPRPDPGRLRLPL